jgi:hypothetical protein
MLCPENLSSSFEVLKSALPIMANADNPRLEAWYKLRGTYTTHCWLVRFLDGADSNRLQ